MRNILLFIFFSAIPFLSKGQIHLNKSPGSGGSPDYRKEHKVWADGSSEIIIDGRKSFKFKKGINPNRIVHAGDQIEVIGIPDSTGRVNFRVYYDQKWVFRIDTIINSGTISWNYIVEPDPIYKKNTSEIFGIIILGILKCTTN